MNDNSIKLSILFLTNCLKLYFSFISYQSSQLTRKSIKCTSNQFLSILKLRDKLIKAHRTWGTIVDNLTIQTAPYCFIIGRVFLSDRGHG